MQTIKVKELMVPLSEYATVSDDESLLDAIIALEKARENFNQDHDKHRAVLVYNKNKKIIGKVSQLDAIKALEPKYDQFGDISHMSRFGLSTFFINSMIKDHMLWQNSLNDICKKAQKIVVRDIMYTPDSGEFVEESTGLDEAIHQLIIGHHQSLIVMNEKKEITGILRLTDVFKKISEEIKACKL